MLPKQRYASTTQATREVLEDIEKKLIQKGQYELSAAILKTVKHLDCVAIVLPMNPYSYPKLLEGCYGKPMQVTVKTQQEGPLRGYVVNPKDQSIMTDQGHLLTSDVDILSIAHRQNMKIKFHEACGYVSDGDLKVIESINQQFSKQLGLDETKVCRHGPFSHLSRLSKTCIKFPLTVYAPWGEDVIEDRHGRHRALEDLRVFVDICQKEGYNARIPLHWLSKEGDVNVH